MEESQITRYNNSSKRAVLSGLAVTFVDTLAVTLCATLVGNYHIDLSICCSGNIMQACKL
ncbi:MAG: hypothetical protein OFPI_06180 [Osedax symbiont Rs2]|nr:MAG: hypothetical protein OFPI_06180 [Osedax symbiont Rs2]